MGPRGCSYLHFISVIRGSEVIKVPNISRVKKVPKFKNVEEMYVSIGSKCNSSNAKCPPKVDRSLAIPNGWDDVKTDVKIETVEESDPDFDAMTLKQLQKTCKSKKRKTFTSVNLMDVKQEDIGSRHQEEEPDLMETLHSWKRRLLKKTKAKKGITKINNSRGRSEGIPHEQPTQETSWEICMPRIKVEYAEFDCPQPEAISCVIPHNTGNGMGEIPTATECCADGDIETGLGVLQSAYLSGTSHEHFQHPRSSYLEAQNCRLNEASYEHLESDQLMNPLISGDCKIEDFQKVNDTAVTGQSLDLLVVEARKEEVMTDATMCDEAAVSAPNCVLNQISYKHLECVQLQNPLKPEDSRVEDTIEIDSEAVSGDKASASPVSELRCVGGISIPMTCEEAPETVFSECDRSDFQDYNGHRSSVLGIPCERDDSVHVQGPWAGPETICQNSESTDIGKAIRTIDENKDRDSEVSRSVVGQQSPMVKSTRCLPSANYMASRGNVASPVEDEQSSMDYIATAHLTCSPDIQPCDPVDLLWTTLSANESCEDNEPRPPGRLFSARKTISPNSQERLCRVMNSIDLQEDSEIHSCREKLSFEKYDKDKSSSKSDIRRNRIIFTSKRQEAISNTTTRQAMRRGKDERKGLHCKGIAKSPHASHNAQNAASRCSSIQSCSQNAILFSQQQMNDIERLAQRLMTEMLSMKDIFVDALQGESRAGAKLRYNTDQVRVVVESATKVEESTRKFLSMMTRDCNRFCKIMRLAEDGGGSPEKTVHKPRKITFADEVGGRLCHVRVFEASETGNGVASPGKSRITEETLGA